MLSREINCHREKSFLFVEMVEKYRGVPVSVNLYSRCLVIFYWYQYKMDSWMTCNFRSFSKVFQSYQEDERLIVKVCVQWNPVYG